MADYAKIGVWQTAFLGDAVLTLPLIAALRQRFPKAEIHFFVRKGVDSLFRAQPELASVRVFDKRGEHKSLSHAVKLGRELGREGFDLWISTHASFRSALVAGSSGIARRIGYQSPWFNRFAYTETVDRKFRELAEIERLFQLVKPLGIETPAPKARMVLPDTATAAAATFWERHCADEPVLGIHPGSTWPTKCWPVEYFSEIASRAAKAGATVLVFAGPGEEDAARTVIRDMAEDAPRERVHDLSGALSLPELAAYLNRLDAYVTNDSGPMHIAWMQDTPVVAMFGPTVRELGFFPRGLGASVMETELSCRPCGLHGPKKCPEGHHRCMRDLTPDRVWPDVAAKLGLI
ncbi:lipopolysaccharide heptosyltransferase II [Pseudodesulfovibrio tunisiensis]|uniref:lipopolysaccharide heptosyltransferase II n=1 Tax=Pseudodesulfovibrio tunisiensis TaxID=463192 RepID=UPI001FB22095|nr:lipopolysaccharide heptosyltransferase II [Pseudodesulfovibrio tunisiensis]